MDDKNGAFYGCEGLKSMRRLAEEREAHEAAVRERDRLQGECGRLQGELRKHGENAPVSAPVHDGEDAV